MYIITESKNVCDYNNNNNNKMEIWDSSILMKKMCTLIWIIKANSL